MSLNMLDCLQCWVNLKYLFTPSKMSQGKSSLVSAEVPLPFCESFPGTFWAEVIWETGTARIIITVIFQ